MNKRQSERCKSKEIDKTFKFWNFSQNLEYDTPSEVGWVICVQICGVLMFSLICAWINRWVNNGGPGDLRHFGATGAIHSMPKLSLWPISVPVQPGITLMPTSLSLMTPEVVVTTTKLRWHQSWHHESSSSSSSPPPSPPSPSPSPSSWYNGSRFSVTEYDPGHNWCILWLALCYTQRAFLCWRPITKSVARKSMNQNACLQESRDGRKETASFNE